MRLRRDFVDIESLREQVALALGKDQKALPRLLRLALAQRLRPDRLTIPTRFGATCTAISTACVGLALHGAPLFHQWVPSSAALVTGGVCLFVAMLWHQFLRFLALGHPADAKQLALLDVVVRHSPRARAYIRAMLGHFESLESIDIELAASLAASELGGRPNLSTHLRERASAAVFDSTFPTKRFYTGGVESNPSNQCQQSARTPDAPTTSTKS